MSTRHGIRAILFDKDGTLVDFDRTWGTAAYPVFVALAGGDPAQIAALAEVSHYVIAERRFLPSSPLLAGFTAEFGVAWARVLGRPPDRALFHEIDSLFREHSETALTPVGEPEPVLRALAGLGYRLGMATNDSEAAGRRHAERLGLLPHLETIYGYDSGHGRKPDPGMILAFAARTGLPPAAIALVGDTTHDMHAARAAGSVGIAVLTGPTGADTLAPVADHVIADLTGLPALLGHG